MMTTKSSSFYIFTVILSALAVASSTQSDGIALECNFQTLNYSHRHYYSCNAANLEIHDENLKISEVLGEHFEGKSNSDVDALIINNQDVKFLPTNLNEIFPNLIQIEVINSNLEEISSENFKGLRLEVLKLNRNKIEEIDEKAFEDMKELKKLFLDYNEIEELSDETFRNCESLEEINLRRNKLRFIAPKLLVNLKNLKKFDFSRNDCTNSTALDDKESQVQIGEVEAIFEKFCSSDEESNEQAHESDLCSEAVNLATQGLQTEINILKRKLPEGNNTSDKIARECDTEKKYVTHQLNECRQKITNITIKFSKETKILTASNQLLENNFNNNNKSLHNKISALERENSELNSQILQLNQNLKGNNETLNSQILLLNQNLDVGKKKLETAEHEKQNLTKQLDDLKQKYENENKILKETIKELKISLENEREKIQKCNENVTRLSTERSNLSNEINELNRQVKAHDKLFDITNSAHAETVACIEKKLENCNMKKEEYKKEIDKCNENFQAHQNRTDKNLSVQASQYEMKIKNLTSEKEILRAKLERFEVNRTIKVAECVREEHLKGLEENSKFLNINLNETQAKCLNESENLKEKIKNLQQSKEACNEKVTKMTQEIKNLTTEMENFKNEFNFTTEIKKCETQKSIDEATIQNLSDEKLNFLTEIQNLKENVTKLREENESGQRNCTNMMESLTQECKTFKENFEVCNATTQVLRKIQLKLDQENEILRLNSTHLGEEKINSEKNCMETINKLTQEKSSLKDEMGKLKHDLEAVRIEIKNKQKTCNETIKELKIIHENSNSKLNDTKLDDIDECKTLNKPCDDGKVCVNLEGSYDCIPAVENPCEKGFEMRDGACEVIDECAKNFCGTDEKCTNLNGGYRCEKIECGRNYKKYLQNHCIRTCKTTSKICMKHPAKIFNFFIVVSSLDVNQTIFEIKPLSTQIFKGFKKIKFDEEIFELKENSESAEIILKEVPGADVKVEIEIESKSGNQTIKQKYIYHVYVDN